jgi:hypothetical protein
MEARGPGWQGVGRTNDLLAPGEVVPELACNLLGPKRISAPKPRKYLGSLTTNTLIVTRVML